MIAVDQSILDDSANNLRMASKSPVDKTEGGHSLLELGWRHGSDCIMPVVDNIEEEDIPAEVNHAHHLSWLSISSFDESHSEMESLVVTLRGKQQQKGRIYSAFASLAIIVIFGFIVASFFTSKSTEGHLPNPADSNSDEIRTDTPKFLMQSFFVTSPP